MTGTSVEVKDNQVVVNVDSSDGWSSSTTPSSAIVGDSIGSVAIDADTVGVAGTRSSLL